MTETPTPRDGAETGGIQPRIVHPEDVDTSAPLSPLLKTDIEASRARASRRDEVADPVIDAAVDAARQMTFGERMRAREAQLDALAPDRPDPRGDQVRTVRPGEVDLSEPLSALVQGNIEAGPSNDRPVPGGLRRITPSEVNISGSAAHLEPGRARPPAARVEIHDQTRPQSQQVHEAITEGVYGAKPERPAPSLPPNVRRIPVEEVDLDAPLGEFLKGGIGKPAEVRLDRLNPVRPNLSTKHDKHPDQVRTEQEAAVRKAREDERWSEEVSSMTE